jgi:hypothetical protein
MEDLAGAEETTLTFLQTANDNPIAHALAAILDAAKHRVMEAVRNLQHAFEKCGDEMPLLVYEALNTVVHAQLAGGYLFAARAHLMLQTAIAQENDRDAVQLMININASPSTPLVYKQIFRDKPAPDDAPWKEQFDSALEDQHHGRLRRAAEKLDEIRRQAPDNVQVLDALAVIRSSFDDQAVAASLWRELSQMEAADFAQRVEAAALAQLLNAEVDVDVDELDRVIVTYRLIDVDLATELALSSSLVQRLDIDLNKLGREGEPPPRAAFALLDRELPESGKDLDWDEVPQITSQVFVYGRQTDRDARLEFAAVRGDNFGDLVEVLASVFGESVGEKEGEQVVGKVGVVDDTLRVALRPPDDTDIKRRNEIAERHRDHAVYELWPHLKLKMFNGMSATEAAKDEKLQFEVLGDLLNLESEYEQNMQTVDIDRLREQLGLPKHEPVRIESSEELKSLPISQWSRLDLEAADDELVKGVYHVAMLQGLTGGVRTAAREILRRDSGEAFDRKEAYMTLIRFARGSDESLELIEKAKAEAIAGGESPAQWLLNELAVRIQRGEIAEVQTLVNTIQSEHIQEPGVGESLLNLLARAGLISPEQMMAMGGQAPQGGPPGAPPVPAAPAGQPAASGEVWTPGTPEPAKESGESKLWIPD